MSWPPIWPAASVPRWPEPGARRVHILAAGIVQGVGFRPFLHRLAARLGLGGWARNTPAGVEMELEGPPDAIEAFIRALRTEPPPLAAVEQLDVQPMATLGETSFAIRPSTAGSAATLAAPDLAPCPACLREMADPAGRRYRYPFINCTDCGPRFSILRALPYDRANTSMAGFAMCRDCAAEYADIRSRRYHAQPNCCPVCGPHVFYLDQEGRAVPGDPIALAQQALAAGRTVAVKGAGGIHLACNARDEAAVLRLRQRKHRPEKPLAVLCRDLDTVRQLCILSDPEAALLQSPRRPIVLLQKRPGTTGLACLSENRRLGILLPYTPLHVLLADGTAGGPAALVLTSANRPGCPVMTDNAEALDGLAGIADGYLLHDRPIVNRCDDSLAALWQGREYFFRRSRGYAPQPLTMPSDEADGILAFGAEQKAGFAAGRNRHVFLSQHIGDLKNAETLDHYRTALETQLHLFGITPRMLVCDLHPDYFSTREAQSMAAKRGLPLLQVQHHWAHMAACMADNQLEGPAFGIVWDGTGLGSDGSIWGGEFLRGGYDGFRRVGSIRPVPLPGGDAAVRQIGRIGLALAWDAGVPAEVREALPLLRALPGQTALLAMLEKGIACPGASSIGRLFDGVYALLSGRVDAGYDGQAPALLESLACGEIPGRDYPTAYGPEGEVRRFDTRPLVAAVCADIAAGVSPAAIARGFMDALARMAREQCRALNPDRLPVVLSGGVFLNQYLLRAATRLLEGDGYTIFSHHRVSASDEGLALGQLALAARARQTE